MIKNILILGAAIGLVACQDSGAVGPVKHDLSLPGTKIELNTNKKKFGGVYAFTGLDNSWPPMSGKASTVAKDLLAKNYYLIVDGSGSMGDSGCSNGRQKMSVAKEALAQFVEKLPNDVNVGMYAFDAKGTGETDKLSVNNSAKVARSIANISVGGGTPLRRSITYGYKALTGQAEKQLGYGEYHLVVVTDGAADMGQSPKLIVNEILNDSPVIVHTIGFCISENHALNVPGKTIYKAANNPKALADGLESVLAESPDFDLTTFGG